MGPADEVTVPFAEITGSATQTPASSDPNQIMYLPFTSGTTGEPKGVMHSDNTSLATARMMVRDWMLDRAVLYTLSPLSHNLGLGALIAALAGGGELVLHDLPRGLSLIDRLEETGANFRLGCRPMPSTCWAKCAPAGRNGWLPFAVFVFPGPQHRRKSSAS